MKVFDEPVRTGKELGPSWVAIGNFDGLHAGHHALLERARLAAAQEGLPLALLTFRPHPAEVLGRGAPPRLCTDKLQEELCADRGVEAITRLAFDASVAALEPEAFVRRVLVDALDARGVAVGTAFRFGRDRRGDATTLAAALRSSEPPRRTLALEPVVLDGDVVSSSRIRALVGLGDMRGAARLLMRSHVLEGEVVRGDARGRTLGAPTANVSAPGQALPAHGVYVTWLLTRVGVLPSVTNVGVRPTFGGGARTIEAHALETCGELAGEIVRLAFVERIRDEIRFETAEALREQIGRDVARAREVLAAEPAPSLRLPPAPG